MRFAKTFRAPGDEVRKTSRLMSSAMVVFTLAAPAVAQAFYTEPFIFQNTFRELCLLRDFDEWMDPITIEVRGWEEAERDAQSDAEFAYTHPDGLRIKWTPEAVFGAHCAMTINGELLDSSAFDELLALMTEEFGDLEGDGPIDADQGWVWNVTDGVSGKPLHAVLGRAEDASVYYYTIVSDQ